MRPIVRDMCGYAGMALLGLALLLWIIPVWSPPWPGYGMPPDLVPSVAAWLLLGLALLGLGKSLCAVRRARRGAAGGQCPDASAAMSADATGVGLARGLGNLLAFMIPCVLLMPAMRHLGFLPAGMAFMALMSWLCGQRRPLGLLLTAALPILAIWALMRFALGVPMP